VGRRSEWDTEGAESAEFFGQDFRIKRMDGDFLTVKGRDYFGGANE
jgi:hypothetical protein